MKYHYPKFKMAENNELINEQAEGIYGLFPKVFTILRIRNRPLSR